MVRPLTAAGFIASGVLHFTHTRAYVAIMPRSFPRHRESVLVSGAAELVGGAAVLHPATRQFARWWLLAVLLAVYPANVQMALNPQRYRRIPPWALWARLPVQALFALSVWRATEDD